MARVTEREARNLVFNLVGMSITNQVFKDGVADIARQLGISTAEAGWAIATSTAVEAGAELARLANRNKD